MPETVSQDTDKKLVGTKDYFKMGPEGGKLFGGLQSQSPC